MRNDIICRIVLEPVREYNFIIGTTRTRSRRGNEGNVLRNVDRQLFASGGESQDV